jgi:DnaJ-class molecular chaperone
VTAVEFEPYFLGGSIGLCAGVWLHKTVMAIAERARKERESNDRLMRLVAHEQARRRGFDVLRKALTICTACQGKRCDADGCVCEKCNGTGKSRIEVR